MSSKPLQQAEPSFQSAWLSTFVAGFIQEQRNHYAASCRSLRPQHLERMAPHFSTQDLQRVVFRNIYPDRLPNPSFYAGLQAVGIQNLPDFGLRKAATFDHVIVTHEPFTPALLFHELVHVVQYRLLGVEGFARFYVQALLAGHSNGATPLDICAQALQYRFMSSARAIDVEGEIRKCLAAGEFEPGPLKPESTASPSWRDAVKCRWQGYCAQIRPSLRASRSGSM